jgi:hypothetical protein
VAIYRNARALARHSDVGLLAGARQRTCDFGIYGYAMTSSPTFGEALRFGVEHVAMASPVVMLISLRIEDNTAILRSHGVQCLGDLLPFAAEFWRSSMTALFSRVLEAPFSTKRMVFTFPPPPHWRSYERMFNCPIYFGRDAMEWHFDASVLDRPCPNANPITARMCRQLCERTMELLLLGEPFSVENRIASPDELLPEAHALAEQILQKPPKALRLMKRLVLGGADTIQENTALGAQLASHEGKEAVAAFIEKRRPNFDLG